MDPMDRRARITEERKEAARRRREAIKQLFIPHESDRLGMPFPNRLLAVSGSAFVAGMALGSTHGAQMAAFRYRAENAHRFPTDRTGWFLYHKTKNYHRTLGGVKSGLKMGASLGFWGASFVFVEALADYSRQGKKDVFSTVIAGLSVAGVYSLKSRDILCLNSFCSHIANCN